MGIASWRKNKVDALWRKAEIMAVRAGMKEGNRCEGKGTRLVPESEVAYKKSRRRYDRDHNAVAVSISGRGKGRYGGYGKGDCEML